LAAALTATVMIAFHMAAKATRDALFLSSFPITALPAMVIGASVVSVALALGATRLMSRVGPARVVPIAFAASAVLLLGEWALIGVARRPIAVLLYLHFSGLGALLISGFWSVINERFDPRAAKKHIGRIAAGGTIGGVLGGVLAERVAVWLSVSAMLPMLALLHLACAWLVLGVTTGAARSRGPEPVTGREEELSGLKLIGKSGYVRGIAMLVVFTTVAEGLLDFAFKAGATSAFGQGEQLLRLFAVFYTATAVLTVLVQSVGSRLALEHLGLTRSVAVLPSSVVVGGAAALLMPGFGMVMALRGIESVIRNGVYRAGYELLYAPISAKQKRSMKALVDVGAVRLGDIVGAGLVQLGLFLAIATAPVLLGTMMVLALIAVAIAIGLQRGYVRSLERSLVSRAAQLDLDEARDAATRTMMMSSAGAAGLTLVDDISFSTVVAEKESAKVEPVPAAPGAADPEVRRVIELRSRDVNRVHQALWAGALTPSLVPQVIALLSWDAVATDAIAALRDIASGATGQLVDRLLDQKETFAVRRRVPLVLAACPSQRSADGLFQGLEDTRFEVRYRCGRALSRVLELNPEVRVDRALTFDAVLREVAVDRGVWESHRLLDRMDDEKWSPVMDDVLRDRANRSLEHVFTMLSLVLPRQPLKIAFRGLHTKDVMLRGTALEYLETSLPDGIREALWPFIEETPTMARERRSSDVVLKELLESNASIVLNLEELRKKRESGSD
jgi:AAA family ATP:ADP antiporter